jgi:MoaA/NifB/PqqE/SkfB family radical SAM enzyme
MNKIKQRVGSRVTGRMLSWCEKDPEGNIPKVIAFLKKYAERPHILRQLGDAERAMADRDNPYRKLIMRVFSPELSPNVRRKMAQNFVFNASMVGNARAKKSAERLGCSVPYAILLDPTSACNLRCKGCWAAEYDKTDNLDNALIDRIITEGKELGIYFYLFSGGEPLVRKDDLIRIAEKHDDCVFLSFTNATLVDEKFAADLARVGNFALAISVEGSEGATDFRRGEGTYGKIIRAMDLLHAAGAPFGFSTCYHAQNVDAVADESYLDFLIEKGCMFGWYFTYIPCGRDALPELMTPPEKRALMLGRVRDWRRRKPIFLMDFWNDGEYVDGCVAGGKNYFHINAAGDVEPCAFIHYSNLNIRDVSLSDALKSPIFASYQRRQPFSKNQLMPCPLLDSPAKLEAIVRESGAHSTQPLDQEDVSDLAAKCRPAARAWEPMADELWKGLYPRYAKHRAIKDEEEALERRESGRRLRAAMATRLAERKAEENRQGEKARQGS